MKNSAFCALPTEAQLLFRLLAAPGDDAEVRALLAGPMDWQALERLARREQAYTVLGQRLRPYGDLVPPAQAAAFAQLAVVAEFHLAQLEMRLCQSVAALGKAGIDVVLLKGAGLAYTAYRSFRDRPMSDVDILVRPEAALAAQRLLGTLGWTWDAGPTAAEFYAHHHHLPPMYDPRGGGAYLELHTGLFIEGHSLLLTAETVWESARVVELPGASALVPDVHHQLLHACLHFAWGHMMQSGAWRTFRDVDAMAASGTIDWDRFVALAESSRGASCCYWTFDLARALGGVRSVPDEVLLRLRPVTSRLVRERIRRHLALGAAGAPTHSPSVRLDRFVWESAIMPDHHGHGRVRPWAQEDRIREQARGESRAAVRRSGPWFAGRLQRVGEYARYLRMMLTR